MRLAGSTGCIACQRVSRCSRADWDMKPGNRHTRRSWRLPRLGQVRCAPGITDDRVRADPSPHMKRCA
jgi:hypothetical protein